MYYSPTHTFSKLLAGFPFDHGFKHVDQDLKTFSLSATTLLIANSSISNCPSTKEHKILAQSIYFT